MTARRPLPLATALICLAAAASAQGTAPPAVSKKPAIGRELNKLEAASGGCRAYFVVENRTADPVKELRLDTFIFDANGQIARRIGLAFPDLRPDRTRVVPFDLAGANCPEIGRVLVNDVLACTNSAGGAVPNCGDLLAVTSRASARFEY